MQYANNFFQLFDISVFLWVSLIPIDFNCNYVVALSNIFLTDDFFITRFRHFPRHGETRALYIPLQPTRLPVWVINTPAKAC